MTRAGIGISCEEATELIRSEEDTGNIYIVGQPVAAAQLKDALH